MNKKLLFGAMLMGAVAFTGCIDDKESPATSKVREAKIAQLAALTNLNEAQAQAEAIAAAATQEAQAAYAALQEAQAAYENAKTETEKIRLQKEIQLRTIALQEKKANLQTALVQAEADAAYYQNELEKAVQAADKAEVARINTILTAYRQLSHMLINQQKDLALKQIELEKWKLGNMTDDQEYADLVNAVKDANDNVTHAQKNVNHWTEVIATLNEKYPSLEAMQTALNTAKADQVTAQATQTEAATALAAAKKTTKDALVTMENSLYEQAVEDSLANALNDLYGYCQYDNDYVDGVYMVNNMTYYYWDGSKGIQVKVPVLSTTVVGKGITYSFGEGQKVLTEGYDEYTSYAGVVAGAEAAITAAQNQAIANQQKELDNATANQAGVAALAAAKKTLTDAQDAVTAAGDKATAAQIQAQGAAQAAYDKLTSKWQNEWASGMVDNTWVSTQVTNLTAEQAAAIVAYWQGQVDKMTAALAKAQAAFALVAKLAPTRATNLAAYNAALAAEAQAQADKNIADNAVSVLNAQINALQSIINQGGGSSLNNYEQYLAQAQENLATCEAELAEAQKNLDEYVPGSSDTAQNKIATLEAEIAKLQLTIEGLQKKLAVVEGQLKDAIDSQD